MSVKVVGVAKVQARIDKLVRLKTEAIKKELLKNGFRIEGLAKETGKAKGVWDTGRLMGSISTNWRWSNIAEGRTQGPAKSGDGIKRPAGTKTRFVVVVGTNVKYALVNEFGSSRMGARPYLFPSYLTYESKVLKSIASVLMKKEIL